MSYLEIDFVGLKAVQQMEGREDTVVISIRDSRTLPARLSPGFRDQLFLEFDNIEILTGRHLRFCLRNAVDILTFVDKHESEASRIVVNCLMGESRSAAVAKFLAEKYSLPLSKPCEKYSRWVFNVLTRAEELAKELTQKQALHASS